MERKAATHGICSANSRDCHSRHFSTLALAEAAYDAACQEMRLLYGTPHGRQWTGKYEEYPLDLALSAGRILKGIRLIPLKKNEQPGKRVHMVYLYPIPPED